MTRTTRHVVAIFALVCSLVALLGIGVGWPLIPLAVLALAILHLA